MKKSIFVALAVPLAAGLVACTSGPTAADYDKMTAEVVKASFVERGIAKLDAWSRTWPTSNAGRPR